LNNPNIQGGDLKIYADASNTAIGGLITIKGKDGIKYPLAFHSRTFPDQYRLKHINILETLALTMVVRKFKGYIQGQVSMLVTDSQYVKCVMEMSGKQQDALPSNVLRWICDVKEETSFTEDSTIKLLSYNKNPADLLTRFTLQNKWGYEDTPWSAAGFDIHNKYQGGHSVIECLGPDYPSTLF
jgi:hypothetical protein